MSESSDHEMNDATVEAVGERLAENLAARFAAFEERMVELENGLRDEVGRVRASVQVVDLLADEVRRALGEHRPDDALVQRIAELESLLRSSLERPDGGVRADDLTPLREALADVLDSVAAQSTEARTERESVRNALAELRDAVRSAPPATEPDLTPVTARLDAIQSSISTEAPELDAIQERLGELAQASSEHAAGTRTIIEAIESLLGEDDRGGELVDLSPVLARIDDLERRIADDRLDLGPLQTGLAELRTAVAEGQTDLEPIVGRIDALTGIVIEQRPDLTVITAALADLRTHLDDSRPDLSSVHERVDAIHAVLPELLADTLAGTAPDLTPLATQLDEVRAAVIDGRTDLGPVLDRIDALADDIGEQRPDLTVVTAALADLRTHLDDSRPDLTSALRPVDALADRIEELQASLPDVVARSAPDLQPIHNALAEIVDALAQQLDEGHAASAETRTAVDRLASSVEGSHLDVEPIVEAVAALRAHYDETRPDLSAIVGALTAMRAQLLETINDRLTGVDLDLAPVIDVVRSARDELGADVAGMREGIDRTLDVLAEHGDSRRISDEALQVSVAETRRSLEPLAADLSALHADLQERTPDLEPLQRQIAELVDGSNTAAADTGMIMEAIDAVLERIGSGPDLDPALRRIDGIGDRVDELGTSVREAVESAAVDLEPVLGDLASLKETVLASRPDLMPLRSTLDEILGALAHGITETRNTGDRIERIVSEIDTTPDLRSVDDAIGRVLAAIEEQARAAGADASALRSTTAEIATGVATTIDTIGPVRHEIDALRGEVAEFAQLQPDLDPVLAAITDVRTEVEGSRSRADELAASLRAIADSVESTQHGMARAESIAQLAARLDVLDSAVNALRSSEDLREVETRLGRRVDASGEALRARIDDQRALADNLAANVSQLNAALTKASEEPQQLRRDLDRILEQLAERMGAAMRELRDELSSAPEEPLALRSSVEAGLDRISGRFQTDAGRILEAVATAQEDADSRLRRIDSQVTELRRTIARVQRDASMSGTATDVESN